MKKYLSTTLLVTAGVMGIAPVFASAESINITGWSFNINPKGLAVMENQIIPAFERSHPNIHVAWVPTSYTGYTDKLLSTSVTGTGPDLFMLGNNFSGWSLTNGMAIPLDDLLKSWSGAKDVVGLDLARFKGHVVTIPFDLKAAPLGYRADLFADAGLDVDHPPQTWNELLTAAKRLTRTDGERVVQAGVSLPSTTVKSQGNWLRLENVLMQMQDSWLLDAESAHVTFDSDQGRQALQWLKDLYDAAVLPPGIGGNQAGSNAGGAPAELASQRQGISNLSQSAVKQSATASQQDSKFVIPTKGLSFVDGTVGISFYDANFAVTVHRNPNAMQEVRAALPIMKGDGYTKRVALGGGNGLSIAAHSKHQQAAWEFLTFLMQPENQVALHLANGTVPMLRSAFLREEFRGDPFTAAVINAAPYLLNFDRGETTPAYGSNSTKVGSFLRDAVIGKVSVATGLTQAAHTYQVALDTVNAKR